MQQLLVISNTRRGVCIFKLQKFKYSSPVMSIRQCIYCKIYSLSLRIHCSIEKRAQCIFFRSFRSIHQHIAFKVMNCRPLALSGRIIYELIFLSSSIVSKCIRRNKFYRNLKNQSLFYVSNYLQLVNYSNIKLNQVLRTPVILITIDLLSTIAYDQCIECCRQKYLIICQTPFVCSLVYY